MILSKENFNDYNKKGFLIINNFIEEKTVDNYIKQLDLLVNGSISTGKQRNDLGAHNTKQDKDFENITQIMLPSDFLPSLNESDIKKYASKIFELKKPIKEVYSTVLNEKYGVNINNLKDIPSLRSLLNTQVVIFEAISKLSPKGSVQKKVLNEVAQMLKTKNGGESIDVNDYLQIMFEEAGYKYSSSNTLAESFEIGDLASEITSIDDLVQVLSEQMGEDDSEEDRQPVDTFDAPGNEEAGSQN